MDKLVAFLFIETNITCKQLLEIISILLREKEMEVFYCEEQVQKRLSKTGKSNEEESALMSQLKHCNEYNSTAVKFEYYRHLTIDKVKGLYELNIKNDEAYLSFLATLTNRYLSKKAFVLIAPDYSKQVFSIIYGEKASDLKPRLINIPPVCNIRNLNEWLEKNRTERTMNKNNKHGENGKGAHSYNKGDPVSVLKCNIEKAQGLLNTAKCLSAIAYNRLLVDYDPEFGEFIIFHDEGDNPQNQYHGYHITEEDIKKKYPNAADELKKLKSDKVES